MVNLAFLLLATLAATQVNADSSSGAMKTVERKRTLWSGSELEVTSVRELRHDGIPDGVLRLDYVSRVDSASDWALIMPPETGSQWIVYLHGHGSHGDQLYTRPDVRQTFYPEFRKRGMGILSPNLRDNSWMSPAAAEDLRSLLGFVRTKYGAKQFIFVSGSMGGTAALIYACLYPGDVSGAVALCPATDLPSYYAWCRKHNEGIIKEIADAIEHAYGGSPESKPELYKRHSALSNCEKLTMPVFIAHGTADQLIPVSQPRRLLGAMGDAGNIAYTEVPGGDHDSTLVPCFPSGFNWIMGRISTK